MAERLEVGRTLADFCRPDRMALVIYDMQVGISHQLPHAPAVAAACREVLDVARRHRFRVIFMRHMSMPRALMGAFQTRQAMAWQRTDDPAAVRPWFLRGTPGFEIVPELAPREDEAVLDKIGFSAFEGTPLATILRDCGLDSFAICGIALEIGIEPTCRHATDLGFVPVVIGDACGAGDPEAGERSLAGLRFMGDVILSGRAELLAAMQAAAPRA